jgi:NAD(P)-dependent dehydrogenase (short-subunit alcohol dehydrogenase family)
MLKNKWGRILNCSGIGVKFGGGKYNYNYSLSQHCKEFIPSVFKQWAASNVFINNIRIGVTDTKLHKKIKKNMNERVKLIPIKRMASPKEMASYITSISNEKNTYMTGQTISVSGGE